MTGLLPACRSLEEAPIPADWVRGDTVSQVTTLTIAPVLQDDIFYCGRFVKRRVHFNIPRGQS